MPDATRLHLGCGDRRLPDAINVDARPTAAADVVHDLDEYPWPFPDDRFQEVVAEHVLEHLADPGDALAECARVLEPGGTVRAVLPVGGNAFADPDHEHRWNWDTPGMYCGARGWDRDVGLRVADKDCTIGSHLHGPTGVVYGGLLRCLRLVHGPGRWQFDAPATSGEFTVIFELPEADP
jgi:SAM-dependent methyltransferase